MQVLGFDIWGEGCDALYVHLYISNSFRQFRILCKQIQMKIYYFCGLIILFYIYTEKFSLPDAWL